MPVYEVNQYDYVAVKTQHIIEAPTPLDALITATGIDSPCYETIWSDSMPSQWEVSDDDTDLLDIQAPRGQEHMVTLVITRTGFVGWRRVEGSATHHA
jgi:hypothetical protein